MKSYFYGLLARYVSLFARPEESLVSIDPPSRDLDPHLPHSRTIVGPSDQAVLDYDFVLLNGTLHYERDIQQYLTRLRGQMKDGACLIVIYYSALWRPILQVATRLGLRSKTPEWNWLSHSDLANFMHLADFDVVRREPKVLLPVYVPLVSAFLNRYIAPLPIFSAFALVNVLFARPKFLNAKGTVRSTVGFGGRPCAQRGRKHRRYRRSSAADGPARRTDLRRRRIQGRHLAANLRSAGRSAVKARTFRSRSREAREKAMRFEPASLWLATRF